MTSEPKPLTEADIVAARVRAAESGVPWDRAKALSEARAKVAAKRAAKRERRNRVLLIALGLLLVLLAILGYLTRS
jgi:hypothetical protein